jgi:hypothetical protein
MQDLRATQLIERDADQSDDFRAATDTVRGRLISRNGRRMKQA